MEQISTFIREIFMDRRQQKTRNAIFQAFNKLLSQKSYSRITVQDIIDAANVGRTTFYAHFETKDELLRELCTDMFEHVISSARDLSMAHSHMVGSENPVDMVTHILWHLRENSKNITGVLSCESGELFLRYFREYMCQLMSPWLQEVEPALDIPRDFLLDHISSSFVNVIQYWIKGGMTQSPETMTAYFMAAIGPLLRKT
jgi:AcrR family transcriptional regulator